ncbi:chloride channel protein, partial [bacterium]|nr:chloride channel protein [bacterium]
MKSGLAGVRQISWVIMRWLKPNISTFLALQKPKLWALSVVAGLAGGIAGIFFRHLIGWIQWLWAGTTDERFLTQISELPWWIVWLAPTFGGLAVGIILTIFGQSCRAGGV